jgi:hypothetical protein
MDLKSAVAHFELLGFSVTKDTVTDVGKNLLFCFMENDGLVIELVSKADGTKRSVIDGLSKQSAFETMPYHICYVTSDINLEIERFISQGYKLLIAPEIAIACDDHMVAYVVHPQHGLVEFIEIP